jgi:hypothetical protein
VLSRNSSSDISNLISVVLSLSRSHEALCLIKKFK